MAHYGFSPYSPKDDAAELIRDTQQVLDEYRDFLPLTVRQIFYRLVGSRGYAKTEKAYKRLGSILGRARRARMIAMENIRDDGVQIERPLGYASALEARETFLELAERYRRDRQQGQPVRIIAACEAAGMVPQLVRVCDPYGVEVRSSGGFDSITAKHDLAQDVAGDGRDTVLLHIGDHDPSGYHLYLNLQDDVRGFIDGITGKQIDFTVDRVAITPEQVLAYGIDTAPAKATDERSFPGIGDDQRATAQAEALPPDLLADLLRERLESYIDLKALRRVKALELDERNRLQRAVSRLRVNPVGRPSALSEERAERARQLHNTGHSIRRIAQAMGVSKSALDRALKD